MAYYFSYHTQIHDLINSSSLSLEQKAKLYAPEKVHCTMLFNNGLYNDDFKQIKYPDIEAVIKDVVIWREDKQNYLVALLHKEEKLLRYNNELCQFLNTQGIETSTREFSPHITLQRTTKKIEPIEPKNFGFLIEKTVKLFNFDCHMVNKQ